MPTPIVFRVRTAEDLEAGLNAALASLLTVKIYGVVIDQAKEVPAYAPNLFACLSYETGGQTLAAPYQAKVFSAPTEAEAIAQFVAFTALNPSYFYSEAHTVYRPYASDPTAAVCLVVFYCSDAANALANWSVPGSVTVPAQVLGFSSLDASMRTPYPIADFDDFNYLDRDTNTTFLAKWWQWNNTGTVNIVYPGNKSPETGVVQLSTGTTTTGRTGLIYGYNQNWEPRQGAAVIRGKVLVDTAPDVANAFAFQLGLMNDTNQDGSGFAFFSADDTSAYWQACYANGAGLIKTPTTVPIVAGEWIDLAITISSGGAVLKFYINGTLVFTASLSNANGGVSYGVRLQKKAGTTARTARVDWLQGVLGNRFRPAIASILPGQ